MYFCRNNFTVIAKPNKSKGYEYYYNKSRQSEYIVKIA